MENQHRKIRGYRELSQAEIDLLNRIKAKGAELLALQEEVLDSLRLQHYDKNRAAEAADHEERAAALTELNRFDGAEPLRWAAIGKTDIQTGIMALVRAVAQPEGV